MRYIITLLIVYLAVFTARDGSAQVPTVQVRAGEHQDYTRLLLEIPEHNTWIFTPGIVIGRLDIAGPALEFDLTQTFSRIPRTRVHDVRSSANGLDIYIACACEIHVHETIPQFLMIDIIGSTSDRTYAPLAAPRPPGRPDKLARAYGHPGGDPKQAGVRLAQALRGNNEDSTLTQVLSLNTISAAPSRAQPTNPTAPHDANMLQPAQIAQELGRVLAHSVSAGMLQPVTDGVIPIAGTHTPDKPRSSANPDLHLSIGPNRPNQTSGQDGTTAPCPDLHTYDLPSWDVPMSLPEVTARMHQIFNASDNLQDLEILNLSKSFLYFGFGAEARMILSLRSHTDPAGKILTDISYIVDLSKSPEKDAVWALRNCGPMGSLWAFLAAPEDVPPIDFPIDNLVQAVKILPANLRLHLGPIVAQRLAGLKLSDQAKIVQAALDRVKQDESPQLTLARAAVALPGADAETTRMLEATLSPQHSDDDLLFLLSYRDAQGALVEASLLEAATTRLFALRGTQAAQEIATFVITAKARAGNFSQAFEILNGRDAGLDIEAHRALREGVFAKLVRQSNDTDFILQIFEQRPWEYNYLSEALAAQLSARLHKLGFDLQADLLQPSQEVTPTSSRLGNHAQDWPINPNEGTARQSAWPGDTLQALSESAADTTMPHSDANMPDSATQLRHSDEGDILRARKAQSDQNTQERLGAHPEPDLRALTDKTEVSDTPTLVSQVETLTGPQQNTNPEPQTLSLQDDAPRAEPDTTLLSQSRDALRQSAELRERLSSLVGQDTLR